MLQRMRLSSGNTTASRRARFLDRDMRSYDRLVSSELIAVESMLGTAALAFGFDVLGI